MTNGDTLQDHITYIFGIIEELKQVSSADYMDQDANVFSINYKRYLEKFAEAEKLLRYSNDIQMELYPVQDPRVLIAKTYDYFLLYDIEDPEHKMFLETFDIVRVRSSQIAKAHFYDEAETEGAPLPTNYKFSFTKK